MLPLIVGAVMAVGAVAAVAKKVSSSEKRRKELERQYEEERERKKKKAEEEDRRLAIEKQKLDREQTFKQEMKSKYGIKFDDNFNWTSTKLNELNRRIEKESEKFRAETDPLLGCKAYLSTRLDQIETLDEKRLAEKQERERRIREEKLHMYIEQQELMSNRLKELSREIPKSRFRLRAAKFLLLPCKWYLQLRLKRIAA